MTDEEKNENEEKIIDEKHVCDCEKLQVECEEYKTGWKRALADYQNLQKEVDARRAEWAMLSAKQILEDFIPVYENFKKAFGIIVKEDEDKWKNWKQGIEYIMKQFGDVLKVHKVEEIKTVGEKFDPHFHEAIGQEEGGESGAILREVDGGYKMGDNVIKVAKVIIAK
ncbi:MAG: nucleotide exchange factor GrpE [Patescibacteria group bacterium]